MIPNDSERAIDPAWHREYAGNMLFALDDNDSLAIPRYAMALANLECHRARTRMREYAEAIKAWDGVSAHLENMLLDGARANLDAYQQAKRNLKDATDTYHARKAVLEA